MPSRKPGLGFPRTHPGHDRKRSLVRAFMVDLERSWELRCQRHLLCVNQTLEYGAFKGVGGEEIPLYKGGTTPVVFAGPATVVVVDPSWRFQLCLAAPTAGLVHLEVARVMSSVAATQTDCLSQSVSQ